MDREEFLAGALALVAAGASASPAPTSTPDWDQWAGDIALPFDRPIELELEFLDMGKQKFRLSDYRGKLVLLNMFATWCGPCNKEQPTMSRVAKQYASSGLVVIGIDAHEPDDAVRRYIKAHNLTYPIAMARDARLAWALGMNKAGSELDYPTSVFINPSGTLYGVVRDSMSDDEIDYRITKFIAANPKKARPSPLPR